MFRHRLQLRRWAACVLALWLFGVGIGVANACVLAIEADAGGRDVLLAVASHDGAHAGVHHDGAPAPSNCQDFCGKAGVSMPPQKTSLDAAHGHALPVWAAIPVVHPTLPAESKAAPRFDADDLRAPLPIQIAFLRLAL